MLSTGKCAYTLERRPNGLWAIPLVYKSCLVGNCEDAVWMVTFEPSQGCSETWRLCCLPLIFLPVLLLLCFFVDGVSTHLHYSSPGGPVLGKLSHVLLNATWQKMFQSMKHNHFLLRRKETDNNDAKQVKLYCRDWRNEIIQRQTAPWQMF